MEPKLSTETFFNTLIIPIEPSAQHEDDLSDETEDEEGGCLITTSTHDEPLTESSSNLADTPVQEPI